MGSVGPGLGLYVGNLQVLWGLLGRVWGCMLATYKSYGVCCAGFGAVCWQPTSLMGSVGPGLGLYVGNLQILWGLLGRVWGCMLATYRSYGVCWTGCGAVYWQPTGRMGSIGPGLGLYIGNLQVLLGRVWGCMLATYRSYGFFWTGFGAVYWQPTSLMGSVGPGLGLYVGNLQVLWVLLDRVWGCILATYRSYGVCWAGFGKPTSLMGSVGPGLGLYVGNLQVLWVLLDRVWGCILATYKSYGVCWAGFGGFGAVCWQPTSLMCSVGPGLVLYVGNLQVLWALIMRSLWTGFGAVCWQPTGLMRSVGQGFWLYVGNLQVWALLGRVWGCMLPTYRSYGVCWAGFGAVCWQPTGLMRAVGQGFGLYVDNLQVLWGLLGRVWDYMLKTYRSYGLCWAGFGMVWGCMLATYRSFARCWIGFGAECWQPTSLMGSVGPGFGLFIGNLQVFCALLGRDWGCMLATYRSYGVCLAGFGAVCWQPTGLLRSVGPGLGLYVGNLQVLWVLLDRVWGCILATYKSYGLCWAGFGAVCWQPTGLMRSVGQGLGLYVGNLQVLWGLLDWVWGCMLATLLRSVGPGLGLNVGNLQVLWAPFGPGLGLYVGNLQVLWGLLDWVWGCMLATLLRSVGPGLGLNVGNLQVLCGLLGRVWGCMLATYRSYGVCWAWFGAVCWQPTGLMRSVGQGLGLMRSVGPGLGLFVGNLQVLCGLLGRVWGCMLATYRSYGVCWAGFGTVCWQPRGLMLSVGQGACWQPTSLMGSVGPGLGLYVDKLQVLWGLMGRVWGCMLATYRSHALCWTGFWAVCWQPTGLMGSVGLGLGLYVGNLQVLCALLDRVWGCMLATYKSYALPLGRVWGCMLTTCKSYALCWTGFRAVCWQPTGLMGSVGPGLGLYVGNLQVLCALLDRVWGCMLATYKSYALSLGRVWGCMLTTCKSYALCWTGFGAVCWQPTGLMRQLGTLTIKSR